MVYTKFVEVGRLVLINQGELQGKVAVIVEIMDHNRVIIDGPLSGVARQPYHLRRLTLTKISMDLPRGARTPTVAKKMEAQEIMPKWSATETAKRLAKRIVRQNLTDFERYKVQMIRRERANLLSAQ